MTALTHAPTLTVRTCELAVEARPELLSVPLHALLPREADPATIVSWVRRDEGLVGWGRVAEHESAGPERFAAASAWWREVAGAARVDDPVDLPGSGLVAFGSFAFAAGSAQPSRLVVPEIVLGRRGGRLWLTTVTAGPGDDLADLADGQEPDGQELDRQRLGIPDLVVSPRSRELGGPGLVRFSDGARSAAEWAGLVERAVERIVAGDLDKVVLARELLASAQHPVDPAWILSRLAERYPTCWAFEVSGLLGATPELLVRREKGLVTSRVLAGTIRRTGDDSHDLALAASLARSSKDLEEHEYAVASVSRALARHCSSMNVPEAPFVLHLANVMHLATDVAAVAADGTSSLDLAASLHPSAAVGGTPTEVATELIAQLEGAGPGGLDRGRYAGPVGWMDAGGDGEWGIALRCGQVDEADPRCVHLYAGCGIVAGSDPLAEVAESDAKLLPMRDALTAGADEP